MILNVSGRCDIVAYFSEWFMNRLKEGYVDVRNPYYPKQVSRIYMENVDAIVFCTKNPIPILKYIPEIKQPILFQVTLTPYKKDIEPNVIDKNKIIEAIQQLSTMIPKEHIYVRYDPIFINEQYTIEYHVRAFERLCERLDGYVQHIIISFIDEYKNVRKHQTILNVQPLNELDYETIGTKFYEIASKYHMSIQTCAEDRNLVEYGFIKQDCVSKEIAYNLTNKKYKKGHFRGKLCECVEMADIGNYNTCGHLCRYCYANYDESQILKNMKNHDVHSSLLIGHLQEDDIIKERK